MGTSWQVTFHASPGLDPGPVRRALQAAVDEVDAQMSTWKPDSDLMRLNRTPPGKWVMLPTRLAEVLRLGLVVGRASGGAFDIGMGDAVRAWGFGPEAPEAGAIRAAMSNRRQPAHEVLELDGLLLRKRAPIVLDLNGIAKGYGVDRLNEILREHGITASLSGIDGEMRGQGLRPDGNPWMVAVEAPDPNRRAAHSILALENAAVATSGDYRHRITVGGRSLSHTMDPRRGAPLPAPPASVTVVARTCAEADAWTTALMVADEAVGCGLARQHGLEALFLIRARDGIRTCVAGRLFGDGPLLASAVMM
jgi:thiamine biosynthesis lipoprotein